MKQKDIEVVKLKRKKVRKSFINRIGDFFRDKYDKYKQIPEKTRVVINIWSIIILIIIFIIIVCNVNNNNLEKYTELEKEVSDAAMKYAEKNKLAGTTSQKVRIEMSALLDAKYLNVDKKTKDTCIGYALVYTNSEDETKAKSYIYCKGYSTEGFSFGQK